ncbi:MAG: hypothetical protein ACRDL0_20575, partial [Thermoleophilaceae bacterium]
TLQAAAALLAALAVPAALALALSPAGALDAVEYHLDRPVQVESLPATGLLLADALGGEEPRAVSSHRSDGLEHPAADPLALACLALMLAVIAAVTARSRGGSRHLVLGALAAVAAFAVLGKVVSPQYMLWLIPLGALAFAWRRHALAAAVGAAAILTHVAFPARYFDLVDREALPLVVVALRNLVLLVALALALRELTRPGHQQLPDRQGEPVGVSLDEDRVQPRVLV